ncbi:hypothetical protein ACRQ5D_00505 [Mucilaginibacter sp. P25]
MENELSKAERTRQFIIERTSPVFNKRGMPAHPFPTLPKLPD